MFIRLIDVANVVLPYGRMKIAYNIIYSDLPNIDEKFHENR